MYSIIKFNDAYEIWLNSKIRLTGFEWNYFEEDVQLICRVDDISTIPVEELDIDYCTCR